MPGIKIDQFQGQIPKLDRHVLPPTAAVQAVNVDLRSGVLNPIREPRRTVVYDTDLPGVVMTTAKRVYSMLNSTGGRWWMMFNNPFGHLVRTPAINDSHERVYFTNPGTPPRYARQADLIAGDTEAIYALGLPKGPAFSVTSNGGSGSDVTRVYVAVYRTPWGEEGPFSDPITETGKADGNWIVADYPNANVDADRNINGMYFYRASTTTGLFYRVRTATFGGAASFNDTMTEAELSGAVPATSQLYGAPNPDLQGLVAHPGGFLVAFVGRDVYMSEPYVPHAWPASYTIRLQHEIVALAVAGESIVVLTKGAPAVLTGTTPETMSVERFNTPLPCLAQRSVVVAAGSVYYASVDGIARVGLGGPEVITTPTVSREDWVRDWFTPDMKAVIWDGNYLALTAPAAGFMFSMGQPEFGFSRISLRQAYDGLDAGRDDGRIYMLRKGNIDVWMSDKLDTPSLVMRWSSKTVPFVKPLNLGAFQIKRSRDAVPSVEDPLEAEYLAYNEARLAAGPLDVINGYPINGEAILPTEQNFEYPPVQPMGGEPLIPTTELSGSDIRFRLFADGLTMFDGIVVDNDTYRSGDGYKGTHWNFELTAKVPVIAVHVATTPTELARV